MQVWKTKRHPVIRMSSAPLTTTYLLQIFDTTIQKSWQSTRFPFSHAQMVHNSHPHL